MHKPVISMIAAVGEGNRVIGNNKAEKARDQIPWRIPKDSRYFASTTKGHAVIMGRTTYESMGKPLPERTNFVVTTNPEFEASGCIICGSIEEAIQKASKIEPEEVFIVGGGHIYSSAIKMADRLYITVVQGNYDGDAFFPDYSEFKKVISSIPDEDNGYKFTFLILEK
ncbi:MAG: dihydrofolate reductase DfrA [Patescibacteria group bacterium]